jgi:hypothetical protein
MAEHRPIRLNVKFPPDLVRVVDDWRRGQPDLPTRSKAIRDLVARGATSGLGARSEAGNGLADAHKVAEERLARL